MPWFVDPGDQGEEEDFRNFVYTSPRDGKIARISLGTYPAFGLDDARKLAEATRKKVQQGKDPRDEDDEAPPKTMAELIDERLELGLKGKAKRRPGKMALREIRDPVRRQGPRRRLPH